MNGLFIGIQDLDGYAYFLLMILAIGLGCLLWAGDLYLRHRDRSRWPTVKAEILTATTVAVGPEGDKVYAGRIGVKYKYKDQVHQIRHLPYDQERFHDPMVALKSANDMKKKSTLTIHVDPRYPQQAVAEVSPPRRFIILLCLGLLFCGFSGIGLIVH